MRAVFWASLPALVGATACGLIVTRELDPAASIAHRQQLGSITYTAWDNDLVLGCIAAGCAVALLARGFVRTGALERLRAVLATLRALVVVAFVTAGLAYFYGGRGIAQPYYPWLWDAFHYTLGAKYHRELGYDGLYDCTLQADAEGKGVLARVASVRDLESYGPVAASRARARRDCHGAFSDARWLDFQTDLASFLRYGRGMMPGVLRDYGYNGTPLRFLLTAELVSLPTLSFENLTWLTLPDVVVVSAFLSLVVLGFGPRLGAIFGLFYFVSFPDRFAHVGGSYLRYAWLGFLVLGIVLLKRRRPIGAGLCVATSAMLNAFPLVFVAGPCARLLRSVARREAADRHTLSFVGASLAGSIAWLLVTWLRPGGPQRHLAFLHKMWTHVSIDNTSRVGLRYMLAPLSDALHDPLAWPSERGAVHLGQPAFVLLVLVLLGLSLWRVSRLDDVESSVLGGLTLLFVPLGLVQYYYACASLLVLTLHRCLARPSAWRVLGGLFVLQTAVYAVYLVTGSPTLSDNVATSWALAISIVMCALAPKPDPA